MLFETSTELVGKRCSRACGTVDLQWGERATELQASVLIDPHTLVSYIQMGFE